MDQRFRGYKQSIRSFMQNHYTDARLAELLAHAQEDKLAYLSCCCFIGVVTADHALMDNVPPVDVSILHYYSAKLIPGAREAEYAYAYLGGMSRSDKTRRRVLIPMIKAEMKRRERARCPETVQQPSLVPVEVA